jgi:hypothetical protein
MTLSNFNQTDKQLQQWFLLLPDGHEGPYSIEQLEQKVKEGLSLDCKIWKQDSSDSIILKDLLYPLPDEEIEPPELPPLPLEDEEELLPDLPIEAEILSEDKVSAVSPKSKLSGYLLWGLLAVTLVISGFLGLKDVLGLPGNVSWSRPQKMGMDTYQALSEKVVLNDWDQKLFFYEATAPDYSRFWLVSPQFYNCDIEAQFTAEEEDLITITEKKISFRSKSKLIDHVAEFDKLEFDVGGKLIPGFYKMNLVATNCEWATMRSKISNLFRKAPAKVELTYRVGITSQGTEALSQALKKLAEDKIQYEKQKKLLADQFWQEVQQKYQTLLGTSLQIEQHFLDFVNSKDDWKGSLRLMIDTYTRKFGSLLTSFVISNEEDFKKLRAKQVKDLSVKTAHEEKLRSTAKGMGHKSMTLIEEWQKLNPKTARSNRSKMKKKVTDTFSLIKKDIEQKLIDVTEEQAAVTE